MHWLTYLYRRLRNLDALEVAQRHQRIALGMMMQAQQQGQMQAQAATEQLAACRAVLAVVMRQRDDYERAVEVLAHKVADLKEQRRQERLARRYWLTRTITPQKVSEN